MSGKREQTRRRNSAALIAAASSLFVESGYQGVGIEAIAARAGLTTGAIYSLFGSKHALLIAVLAENLHRAHADIDELRDAPDLDARHIVRAYARARFDHVTSAEGWRMLRLEVESLALVMHEDTVRRQLAEEIERQTTALAALLSGRRRGPDPRSRRITEPEARQIAAASLALLAGLAQRHAVHPDTAPDLAAWEDAAMALVAVHEQGDGSPARERPESHIQGGR